MPRDKIIIKSALPSKEHLPGTLALPDGTQPIRLGSGTITSLISSGGMALVYEIWNPELEVKRAVKLLHPDHTPESEERFYTEMKISAKLHHPNIVEIYGVGRWNGLPFIEMERIDGITMQTLLSQVGSLPPDVCTSIGIMIGRALNYAHNQSYVIYGKEYKGIIHRDLKPGNIMITKSGRVKLMDFGIARPINASIHTCEGTVVGTMQYLAPEQLDGTPTDARSDIYSLGTVLYESITGIRAFPEVNITKLVPDKLANNFVPLEDYSLKTPQALCNIVHKCMRYEKEKRVQSMADFLHTLGSIHKNLSSHSPEQVIHGFLQQAHREKKIAKIHHRHRRRTAALVWTLVVLCLGAAGTVGYLRFGPQQIQALQKTLEQRLFLGKGHSSVPEQAPTESVPPPEDSDLLEEFPVSAAPPTPTSGRVREQRPDPAPSFRTRSRSIVATPAVSSKVPSPPPPAQPEVKPPSLLEQLAARHGTKNIMTIFASEVELENYGTALKVYKKLPLSDALSTKAIVYRVRAANGAGDRTTLNQTLLKRDVDDGEFLLEKAQYYYRTGDLDKATTYLDKASRAPTAFMNPVAFRRDLLFGKGLCASAAFDRDPTERSRREAMSAWYEVKSLLRTNPEHQYFKRADEEIRRVNKRELAKK